MPQLGQDEVLEGVVLLQQPPPMPNMLYLFLA